MKEEVSEVKIAAELQIRQAREPASLESSKRKGFLELRLLIGCGDTTHLAKDVGDCITATSRKCKLACRRLHPIFVAADCESLDTLGIGR